MFFTFLMWLLKILNYLYDSHFISIRAARTILDIDLRNSSKYSLTASMPVDTIRQKLPPWEVTATFTHEAL